MQNLYTNSFNAYVPPTSADVDINLSSLGITSVHNNTLFNPTSNLSATVSCHSSKIVQAKHEVDAYTKFVHEYIKEMYCARVVEKKPGVQVRVSGHNKNNSWGEVIYSFVRCGLVHNMNVTGKKNNIQEQIKVVLTHVPFQGKDCRVYKFGSYDKARLVVGNDEAVVLVINAFDLCDAVRKAIIRMFQKSKVRASACRVLIQRPIVKQIS